MELNISKEDFKRIMLSEEDDDVTDDELIKEINEGLADIRHGLVATLLEGGPNLFEKLVHEELEDDCGDYFLVWCFTNGIRTFENMDEFLDAWYEFMRYVVDKTAEGELTEIKNDLEAWLGDLAEIKDIENRLRDGL